MFVLPFLLPYSIGHVFWASWCPLPVNVNNFYVGSTPEYNPILTYATCPVGDVWKPANGSCLGCYCINGFVSRCFLSTKCSGNVGTFTSSTATIVPTKSTLPSIEASNSPATLQPIQGTTGVTPTSSSTVVNTTSVTITASSATFLKGSLKSTNSSLFSKLIHNKTVMAAVHKATAEILGAPSAGVLRDIERITTTLPSSEQKLKIEPTAEVSTKENSSKKSCGKVATEPLAIHELQEAPPGDDSEELTVPKGTLPASVSSLVSPTSAKTTSTTNVPGNAETTEIEVATTEDEISSESEEETTSAPPPPPTRLPERRLDDADMLSIFSREMS